ncbi:MAG: phosphoribosylformylglycinamidine synthase subunit PurL [Chloroflexi bacterium]|nr:phosphoribosylformylglycinamidine synthase subunit PurL [Chloroflexota bacterium]
MPVARETLEEIALTPEEYEVIVERLGREPNPVELGLFGTLWSEHCGYKHSRKLLGLFPKESPALLIPPGEENAGAVDIGDGLAAVFKIESHNHPSAVEPYQGAATGVGGIVRDILAMGARPIALVNSLRFGPLSETRSRYLFQGVVAGISGYGNCIGIPDVAGEVFFSQAYRDNPLVNALCLGIAPIKNLMRAAARTPGHLLVLVGAATGRDGIHGASGLASRTFEEDQERRPAVQVGNPFLEKLLIEACLEVARAGLLEGLQDLGAGGLSTAVVESAARGGRGFVVDVAQVPRRDEGMTPYEVMLSESQERMLLVVPPENLERVKGVFEKWDIPWAVMGTVTPEESARVLDGGQEVANVSVALLAQAPVYEVRTKKPAVLEELHAYDLGRLPEPPVSAENALLQLLGSPNIASKEWVYRQYDHHVQTNTILGPGQGDAALLWIKGTRRALGLTADGNGRLCYLDPYTGGAMAVAEACRNLVCAGAHPLAITDCLNFGDPERPEVAYQLEQCVRGMAEACRVLGVPVVSGNVSLYNETRGQPVYPTPVVGALGLLEDIAHRCQSAFQGAGDIVLLLGAPSVELSAAYLAGSEYLELAYSLVAGRPPALDLELEAWLQRCCLRLVQRGLLRSAHDCSEGGLAVALAESAIQGNLGFMASFPKAARWDAALFGERSARIVVSVEPARLKEVEAVCQEHRVPFTLLGAVTPASTNFLIPGLVDLPVAVMAETWRRGLERLLR